ncbi:MULTISPECIES: hypothetical protein [unclassified Anabaena]|uniref:hypothetical protein n=1 Tax=unclassified Anabaena TaxID=2619674 RepID=UPI001445158D|nr:MULTISPECIES: hypothetical protein [unclassified Anabaena]MTJ06830.1 hypothetical protein [Anabaena sp. UHCC 0204]MTJ54929.1 hypothetical protein [Anabaena sp. UHCC 0253]
MKKTRRNDPNFKRLISQISPEILATLTDEQIEAIYRGFCERSQANHFINWRISFPIPGLKLYLVLLAGEERRSQVRLRQEKSLYPILTPINILFLSGFLGVIFSSIFTVLFFVLPAINIPSTYTPHTTSIPWIDDEHECQKTGRIWNNNKCWDDEHSPDF